MPITNLITTTRKNYQQKQQQQRKLDLTDTTMETEFRLKRPNTTLPPTQKPSSIDGKKKKSPSK
jgi:hypothetical protein